MRKKAIVAGHICLDITPAFPEKEISRLDEILAPGRLIETGRADIHTGGAVANTGLAMKMLGANVTLMGKIGNDMFGETILSTLKKYGANSSMIISEDESTSYSVVLAFPGIDRIFLHNPGANNTFRISDLPEDSLKDTALFHFGYPPLMRSMYENTGEELLRLMKYIKEKGIATSLDMAAVDASSDAGKADWEHILEKVLPYVNFFVPSAEELCYMLDRERLERWQKAADGKDVTETIDIESEVRPLAEQCLSFGAKVVLVKCGAQGLYYRTADRRTMIETGVSAELDFESWADKEGFQKSFVPDKVLSGTGAGDTSIAAFLTAMLEGYSLERCVRLAAAMGASCVAAYDALSGLKAFDELERKIDAGWAIRS